MQVLLRTASTLARACSDAAQQIEVRPTLRMTVHQNYPVSDRLSDASTTALRNIEEVLELHTARAAIRRLIGHANNDMVDSLLIERDTLNQDEKYLNALIEQLGAKDTQSRRAARLYGSDLSPARTEHDVDEVQRALDNIRQRMETVTTGDVLDHVDVPVLAKEQVKLLQSRVAALRRRRSIVNDQLAAENLKHHIILPTEVVGVLRKHQIIE